MTRNIEENDPVTEENIPWYLKNPIEGANDDEEGEWHARPYFGEISINREIKAEHDAISQDVKEVNVGIASFDSHKKPGYLSNNFRVRPQNKLHSHSPRRISIPFDQDESEEWHYSWQNKRDILMSAEIKDTDTETHIRKRGSTVNEDIYSIINVVRSQSEPNIPIFSPERHTSGEVADGSVQKENDRTRVNKLKQERVTEFTNHDQYLDKASQKKEQSLSNTIPSTDIHERRVIVEQPHHRQEISIDASNNIHPMSDYMFEELPEFQVYYGAIDDILIRNSKQEKVIEPLKNHNQILGRVPQEQSPSNTLPSTDVHAQPHHRQEISKDASNDIHPMSDYLFEELPEFQPYNGTIDDLLKYSVHENNISRNREETLQFIIQCLGIISLCVYIIVKLQQYLHRIITMQTSKRKTDHTCANYFIKAEVTKKKVELRNDKSEGQTELSAIIKNGDTSKFVQDLASGPCTQLLHEQSNAYLVVEKCETENSTLDLLLDETTSFSQKRSSTKPTLGATIIYPVISEEVLTDGECGLENSLPELSLDQSVSCSSEMLITKPDSSEMLIKNSESGASSFELKEGISSDVININKAYAQASMSGIEVADYIKTLTSSFSQEGLDDQAAFQLAQMALEIKYKEMSEIRRIQLEERRRNEDMRIEERRHQQKIKAMSQDFHNLRDEAQKGDIYFLIYCSVLTAVLTIINVLPSMNLLINTLTQLAVI